MRPSIFLSHASEDKPEVARPLAAALRERGFDVWFDEFVLNLGDSLLHSIDRGLRECDFGVVVLSEAFFAKQWPQRELAGLFAREDLDTTRLLPIWHRLTLAEITRQSPILADRLAASTEDGLDVLVDRIVSAIRPRRMRDTGLAGSQFVIPITVTGRKLFSLAENYLVQQHGSHGGAPDRLRITLFDDLSGIDEDESGFTLDEEVVRSISGDDIRVLLNGQAFVPSGYFVVRWGVKQDVLWDTEDGPGGRPFDLREIPQVVITTVVEQQFVRDDELVSFVTALVKHSDGLSYHTHTDFWDARDSPGRSVVRRLAQQHRLNTLVDLIRVDPQPNRKPTDPKGDYRAFCLARAIVMEMHAGETRNSPIAAAMLGEESPLNAYWQGQLRVKLEQP